MRRNKQAEQRTHKVTWNQAIAEGRMVNFGEMIRPYNSPAAAQLAVEAAREAGSDAFIVPPELAQTEYLP